MTHSPGSTGFYHTHTPFAHIAVSRAVAQFKDAILAPIQKQALLCADRVNVATGIQHDVTAACRWHEPRVVHHTLALMLVAHMTFELCQLSPCHVGAGSIICHNWKHLLKRAVAVCALEQCPIDHL